MHCKQCVGGRQLQLQLQLWLVWQSVFGLPSPDCGIRVRIFFISLISIWPTALSLVVQLFAWQAQACFIGFYFSLLSSWHFSWIVSLVYVLIPTAAPLARDVSCRSPRPAPTELCKPASIGNWNCQSAFLNALNWIWTVSITIDALTIC